jgi:osmotically-inducible protein OsmY
VTLRGPVESQAEKAKIGELARKAAGVKQVKVNNQLEVKGE